MSTETIKRQMQYQDQRIEKLQKELAQAQETRAELAKSYRYHRQKERQNKSTGSA